MILMAPMSVLLSKPVWFSLAPDLLGSGLCFGTVVLLCPNMWGNSSWGFPVERRRDKRTCAEMRYKEGIMLDNFLRDPPPPHCHSLKQSPTETRRMQTRRSMCAHVNLCMETLSRTSTRCLRCWRWWLVWITHGHFVPSQNSRNSPRPT